MKTVDTTICTDIQSESVIQLFENDFKKRPQIEAPLKFDKCFISTADFILKTFEKNVEMSDQEDRMFVICK